MSKSQQRKTPETKRKSEKAMKAKRVVAHSSEQASDGSQTYCENVQEITAVSMEKMK